jgi:hypothetical protein
MVAGSFFSSVLHSEGNHGAMETGMRVYKWDTEIKLRLPGQSISS